MQNLAREFAPELFKITRKIRIPFPRIPVPNWWPPQAMNASCPALHFSSSWKSLRRCGGEMMETFALTRYQIVALVTVLGFLVVLTVAIAFAVSPRPDSDRLG